MKFHWIALFGLMATLFAQEIPPRDLSVGEGVAVVPFEKVREPVPLFFTTAASSRSAIGWDEVVTRTALEIRLLQGKPEVLSLAWNGMGEVVSVTGEGLQEWALRRAADGARYLDLKPKGEAKEWKWEVTTRTDLRKGRDEIDLPLPGAGGSTGMVLSAWVDPTDEVEVKVVRAEGLVALEGGKGLGFQGSGTPRLAVKVLRSGVALREVELMNAGMDGRLSTNGTSMELTLKGELKATKAGAVRELLGGRVAMSGDISGEGWHVRLRPGAGEPVYEMVADRAGTFPLQLKFQVPVIGMGDAHRIALKMPIGVVVPIRLSGLAEQLDFDRTLSVVPQRRGEAWQGFLPSTGVAELGWRTAREQSEGELFFSSTEVTETRVGSGLLRQSSALNFRVLQGRLGSIRVKLEGPGEILSVQGAQVLSWSVTGDGGTRLLEVVLNQPMEGEGKLQIESQAALGGFPVKTAPLRLIPEGALRHSGWVRVTNQGSVKLEVTGSSGMMQLAPTQFPAPPLESTRQVFVYRFPAADRSFEIQADQVLPEVGVNEVTLYEIAETDRRILSDVELDIREAPLREWELMVPEDYAVASVTGASVADFIASGTVVKGERVVKVLFKGPAEGRQLIQLKLEKNQSAQAGDWELPRLGMKQIKSRRGFIGVISARGFRVTPGKNAALAEVPLSFFPKQMVGLQQAFRLKDADWLATMKIEALGQSVQADVFHLYSLKAGAAYGSVLVNYYVVGAPATEWRISVPEALGNLEVTGQNVGRDWRREKGELVIPLSRPVIGAGTVLVTFEQPMSARGGAISPGEVRPLGVQAERGYVQVVSPLQVNYDLSSSEGPLLRLEANELPPEYRLLTNSPTLAAWQYTARDFRIQLNIRWFEPGETAEQVVDFLKLSSQVSRDGQMVTEARLFVKSKSRQALRLKLPEKAELWETWVDGATANARMDGSDTLVPLPAKQDPNDPVEVRLRYGMKSDRASSPELLAPVLLSPVVLGDWTISGDEGRRLIPSGGNVELVRPVQAPSGFSQLSAQGLRGLGVLLVLGILAALLGDHSRVVWRSLGLVAAILLGVGCYLLVTRGSWSVPSTQTVLEYSAPVVAAGQQVRVELSNVAPWRASVSWVGMVLVAGGIFLAVKSVWKKEAIWRLPAVLLACMGILMQRGSGPIFLILLGLTALGFCLVPLIRRLRMRSAVVAAWMLCGLVWGWPADVKAEEGPMPAAESMIQRWSIDGGRLLGEMDLSVRGEAGDRFLLLRPPAVLTEIQGAGLRAVKAHLDDADAYFVVMEAGGRATATVRFEMPLERPQQGWSMPTGLAAVQRVSVRWKEKGWQFEANTAVAQEPIAGLPADESGSTLVLSPQNGATFRASPRQRDVSSEEVRYFSEVGNLFVPGPGVVNGRHRVTIRPTQGRVKELVLRVPDDFTVGEVFDGPVGAWRFDPRKRELRVSIEPAQQSAFSLTVDTQRGSAAMPVELSLAPMRVQGSAGEVGTLALAFGDEAQPENLRTKGLSVLNLDDFDGRLLPMDAKKQPLALLQRVYRYGSEEASLQLKVAAVAAELRSEMRQLVSLGEDRLLLATDLAVTITRAGVFRLTLEIPDGLEVESATGGSLSHWTESKEGDKRLMTLHLNGRTIGRQDFSLTFSGAAPTAQASWNVPRISLRDASRETGTLVVVPERGLQVRAVNRSSVSQLDPRELGDVPEARHALRPGALAFRLLQADWKLSLAIERLDAWVTAQVLHDVTLREGQNLHRLSLQYRVENASVKTLRVRLPGLDETSSSTVRASGTAVGDFVPVEGSPGLWDIRLQRGLAGDTTVEIEFQTLSKGAGKESIEPIVLENVRQLSYFVLIHAGGRLEIDTPVVPRGWQRSDLAVVQASLPKLAAAPASGRVFKVAEAEAPLVVEVKRHELANALKLRVTSGSLMTLLSPVGEALTAVDLQVQVVDKSTLRLHLPKDAGLFNVLVNGEGAPLVREGDDWLFHVYPAPEGDRPASVRFVYSAKAGKDLKLEGPALDVPLEQLSWRVLVPDGWKLDEYSGDFDLKDQTGKGVFRLEDYRRLIQNKKESAANEAVALLDQANRWLVSGDQDKASYALSKASRSNGLDAASNEDARVQQRQLRTQQAVLGLNTRRQKLYLDNRSEGSGDANVQLERAANDNPLLRGNLNYDPGQYDQLMAGNTADETTALKAIAGRIVSQQLAVEPAPVSLDVTLPERGTLLTFSRSVQVNGGQAMSLQLDLKRVRDGNWLWGVALAGVLVALVRRRSKTVNAA